MSIKAVLSPKTLHFTVKIKPFGQQRARHTKKGIAYLSAEQKERQGELDFLLLPYKPKIALKGAIRLDFTACFAIPTSYSKKKIKELEERKFFHISKPDKDNIEKAILDSLNRIGFFEKDDCQVCSGYSEKKYSKQGDYIKITISELF